MKQTVMIPIEGLTRESQSLVKEALFRIDGVLKAAVRPSSQKAMVTYEDSAVTEERLQRTIRRLGLSPGQPVKGRRFTQVQDEMTFVLRELTRPEPELAQELSALRGVSSARVQGGQVSLLFDPKTVTPAALYQGASAICGSTRAPARAKRVKKAGAEEKTAEPKQSRQRAEPASLLGSWLRTAAAWLLTGAAVVLAFGESLGLTLPASPILRQAGLAAGGIIALLLSMGILFRGFRGLFRLRPGWETSVSLSLLGLFAAGASSLFPIPQEKTAAFCFAGGILLTAVSLLFDTLGRQCLKKAAGYFGGEEFPVRERLLEQEAALGWYFPVFLLAAGAGVAVPLFLGGSSIGIAAAIFLSAAPCLLGFAQSLTVRCALSRAKKLGITFSNPQALWNVSEIERFLLRGTGVLTQGNCQVEDLWTVRGVEARALLQAAMAAQQDGEHPISQAILSFGEECGIAAPKPEECGQIPGRGSWAVCGGQKIIAGSREWLEQLGVLFPQGFPEKFEGGTLVAVARDGTLLGALALSDLPRKDAAQLVSVLKDWDADVWVVTGMEKTAVEQAAARAGVSRLFTGLSPRQKEELTHRAAMDGPVGVVSASFKDSMGMEAVRFTLGDGQQPLQQGEITLPKGDLLAVADTVSLSQTLQKVLRQNRGLHGVTHLLAGLAAGGIFFFFGAPWPALAAFGIGIGLSLLAAVIQAGRLLRF